ncbi:hypothetical protein RHODGE_RHODGE_03555 [Rhodoplanes serenus]|uniref:RDD domain-containing protein n=1 Tax=Rhodoplanes serenus TaxID=200615 RepID=A0A447CYS5_9BRAD|nr:RDD family protein [Rhodoplanes serenus]VCU10365.1 hypothetical protein RHODGE_RHODGE_03555 [Rhodoplanes serenus]
MSASAPSDLPLLDAAQPASARPAPLWRRLIAFTLDTTLLGAIGYGVGMLLFDWVVGLGLAARLIGLVLALGYFGLADSRLTGGRSFGKRLLGLAVVGPDGAPLSIGAATLRALVLMAPVILNDFDLDEMSPLITGLWSFLVIGVGLSLLYLVLFNRPTRQSLHDLVVGARVIDVNPAPAPTPTPTPAPALPGRPLRLVHRIVVGVLCAVSIGYGLVLPSLVESSVRLSELLVVRNAVRENPAVRDATVARRWQKTTDRDEASESIVITAVVRQWPADPEAAARDIAGMVLKQYPQLVGERPLIVKVVIEFNLGIANYSKSQGIETSAATWPKAEPLRS